MHLLCGRCKTAAPSPSPALPEPPPLPAALPRGAPLPPARASPAALTVALSLPLPCAALPAVPSLPALCQPLRAGQCPLLLREQGADGDVCGPRRRLRGVSAWRAGHEPPCSSECTCCCLLPGRRRSACCAPGPPAEAAAQGLCWHCSRGDLTRLLSACAGMVRVRRRGGSLQAVPRWPAVQ